MKTFFLKIKAYFKELLRLKRSPHSIAFGFSIGTFLALLPTFGFAPFLGVILVFFFDRINKISLFASFVVWNIFLLTPMYLLSYKIGSLLIAESVNVDLSFTIQNMVHMLSRRFLIGNIILATSVSLIIYVVLYFSVKTFQERRHKRRK